jgi:CubicO group peptidase (beta-lactamase class C family)
MSEKALDDLRDAIASTSRALVVVRNEKIVYEWYPEGRGPSDRHSTASLAKAIVGGLSLAVAMEDGLIALDDPAWKYVPAWKEHPLKSKITIRHLGSHTSGLDDSHHREERARGIEQGQYTGWAGDFWRWRQGDRRPPDDAFTISRDLAPLRFEPGTDSQYSNPGMAMLTWCVTASLKGQPHPDLRSLLRERIMRPMGIADEEWTCGYGITETVDGLPMVANWGGGNYTPRSVARLGRLVLREGDWDGRQLLSPQTVRAMTSDAGLPAHFGMGWWTNADGRLAGVPRDAVWGLGAGHQILLVVPSLNLIMVRNGGDLFSRAESSDRIGQVLLAPVIAAVTDARVVTPSRQPASSGSNPGPPADAVPKAPYAISPVLGGIEFDFSTHRRLAIGSDNWPVTWAADGHQYAAWGDGGGFGGSNQSGRVTLGVARIEGAAHNYVGKNVWGGVDAEARAEFDGKSYGILSVDGTLYMWVASQPRKHLDSCRIAWSEDLGQHWKLADWNFTHADRLTIPTFLNFGRDYQDARDRFVYSYFIHPTWGPEPATTGQYGFDVHQLGRIYLARVPKAQLLDRGSYEFFAGMNDVEEPLWTRDLDGKRPVFEDDHGVGWNVSVSYAAAQNRYLLCTEHSATHAGNLGVFDSPTPWGPWTTVAYELGWGAGHIEPSTFYWSFPNKWLNADGHFTMVFTGKNSNDSWNTVQGRLLTGRQRATAEKVPPVPNSPVIRGIEWAPPEEIVRAAAGCDNWPLTWGDDDHLYAAYGDGRGFEPFVPEKLSLGFARITGGPESFVGFNLRSTTGESTGDDIRGRKASGLIMVDGVLYLLVRNVGNSRLGWSRDHGQSWQWADWKFTEGFGCPTFLNFGRDYAGARDSFLYVYSTDSNSAYVAADRFVMARVPRESIERRETYEFFVKIADDGAPVWSADIGERGAVLEHPGRCYRTGITYNAGLKRYLWTQVFPESTHRNGPRFQGGFGVFDAPEPWGPWTTASFTNNWDVGPGETCCFPSKWMSVDGRTVHLVFSGDDHFAVRRARLIVGE